MGLSLVRIRPYRDANCGSARLLTLSKVTLSTSEIPATSNSNSPSKPLDTDHDQRNLNDYLHSRNGGLLSGVPVNRPVTRSLTRLAAPRESHNPCPRTLRAKNRNHVSSSLVESNDGISQQKLAEKSSEASKKGSPPPKPNTIAQGKLASANNQLLPTVSHNNNNAISTRVTTRSSVRTHSYQTSTGGQKTLDNNASSGATTTTRTQLVTTSSHPSTKASSAYRSVISNKSTTYK
ncbi:unnamed protein product [Orchesella dallaii]|uniref:Uncharacterized protein n=1 Tax=Orchesella dallaii TaxID=48710 RepID=A0ABP1PUQ9_9HEXA